MLFKLLFPCRYCIVSLWLFSVFFFSSFLQFSKLNYDFFGFILFVVHFLKYTVLCLSTHFGSFQPSFSHIFFRLHSLSFFFWNINDTNVRSFVFILQIPCGFVQLCQSVFSLLFKLHKFTNLSSSSLILSSVISTLLLSLSSIFNSSCYVFLVL